MLRDKKISYVILTVMVLFSVIFAFWVYFALKDFSFEPAPFASLIDSLEPAQISSLPNEPVSSESPQKKALKNAIKKGKEFLYRMEDENYHGFHKYYYAETDSFENRLHTVYSASIIYTFLYIYDYDKDEEILTHLNDWADFLVSMQETDKSSQRYGAFSYSYFLDENEKEKRYVVGTSALSIFTLLRLHEITGEEKYLHSAKLAGDWLVFMQRQDGVMKPYVRHNGEKWVYGNKFSLLYSGQSLSALSKLYQATGEKKYYDAAKKTADLFAEKYEEAGRNYVVGEYRAKNPISNTWIVMSLMDYYKAAKENYYKDIVFELSSQIIANQMQDGRIDGAYSTSGNGWISEVMTDTYSFCLEQERQDCEKYKKAALKIMEWIMERTYEDGGVFWNKGEKYVRTDSVCHALNGYTRMIKYLK